MTEPVKIKWSHSSLKDFEGCARRFYEVKVLKKYPFQDTVHTRYGVEVHAAIEHYILNETPLPEQFKSFQPVVDAVLTKEGRRFPELEMAVTKDLAPCAWDSPDAWARGISDLTIVNDDNLTAWVVDWKGLALDTLLPTPSGWTTMGAVRVGDVLFSENGEPCRVLGKSEVKNKRCFEVCFSDTTRVVCDDEHLWKLADGCVVPVTALNRSSLVLTAAPLALEDAVLPVDPYVLGLWLADGKHTSGEISKPDAFVWEEIQRRGYKVNMDTGGNGACPSRTVLGLSSALRAFGLLGNKHIPALYLRAGYQQRLDLLRGLMDGDGNANPTRKQAVFTSTVSGLSDQVFDLLCSLGQRPLKSVVTAHGFGKEVQAYPLSFRPLGINPFLLPRKAARIDLSWGPGHSWRRRVVSVQEVPSVPTQCIMVDSKDRTFLCTKAMIPTHNTGSDKYPDRDQLVLMSLMTFVHFPHVRKVNSGLLFIVKGTMVKMQMKREQAEAFWWKYRERIARLEASYANNVWNPNHTGLCKAWCPVISCEFNGKHHGKTSD